MVQQRHSGMLVAVFGDELRVVPFDHRGAGVMHRRHEPNRNVLQQHPYDAGMSQAVHRHHYRIEPDGGDDLVDLAMIALAGIVPQGLPSPCSKSGASLARPLAASFNLAASCTVIGTE